MEIVLDETLSLRRNEREIPYNVTREFDLDDADDLATFKVFVRDDIENGRQFRVRYIDAEFSNEDAEEILALVGI